MKLLAKARQAGRGVVRFRRRSLFMMAGSIVGIASLTVLDSIGENTRRETMARVKNMLGTFDTVIIRPGGGKTRGMVSLANVEPVLKFGDAAAIGSEVSEIRQVAQLQNAFDVDVTYRDRQTYPGVFGVSSNWLDLRGDRIERGRFFDADAGGCSPESRSSVRMRETNCSALKMIPWARAFESAACRS